MHRKATLPRNSPDLSDTFRKAARLLDAATARVEDALKVLGEDGPFVDAVGEKANELQHYATRLRSLAAQAEGR